MNRLIDRKGTGSVEISIVIPAYNEAERLPGSLKIIQDFLSTLNLEAEVIVIVEKSEDGTLEVGRRAIEDDHCFKIIDNRVRLGKGYAVRTGMLMAGGRHVFFMDADLSTPLSEVSSFLSHFATHPEVQVLIGSRSHSQSRIFRRQRPVRENMGKMFNLLVQRLAMKGITDTQCGFKAFRPEACREIFSRQKLNGFAFDVEVLILARSLGYLIEVLPVKWANSPESKVHVILDSFKMLIDLLRVRRLVGKSLREKPHPCQHLKS